MARALRRAVASASLLGAASPASPQLIQPRLTGDGKALILLEEIQRQLGNPADAGADPCLLRGRAVWAEPVPR